MFLKVYKEKEDIMSSAKERGLIISRDNHKKYCVINTIVSLKFLHRKKKHTFFIKISND